MPRLIRSAFLTDYVEVARSFGLDPYRLLKEARLDRSCLLDPDVKISADACHWLLEASAIAAQAEDVSAGAKIPQQRPGSPVAPE